MPIDNCPHTFKYLAGQRLPELMEKMRACIKKPQPMAMFAKVGCGQKGIVKKLKIPGDFPGCYVLIDKDGEPLYVGISRGVVKRLRQHVFGKTHFDASLAYRMARCTVPPGRNSTRSRSMQDEKLKAAFDDVQECLRSMSVAFIEIQNDLELYLFEAYCAMELDTAVWNTFRTH